METPVKKRRILKAFLKGLFRGLARSLPFGLGNVIVETSDMLTDNKMPDKSLVNDPGLTPAEAAQIDRFRRIVQILIQLGFAAALLYAFFTKQISIDEILKFFTSQAEPVV